MAKRDILVVSLLALVGAVGCIPEKRVVWSPDGERALVRMGGNRLFLLEGPELKPRDLGIRAYGADWLPDGRRAVATVTEEHATWDSLAPNLSAADRERVVQAAKKLADAVMAFEGPLDQFEAEDFLPEDGAVAAAALVCLRDTASAELKTKVGEKWGELKDVKAAVCRLVVLDTAAKGGGPEAPESLGSVLSVLPGREHDKLLAQDVRPFVAPHGRVAALLVPRPEQALSKTQPAFALALCSLDPPGVIRIVDEHVGYAVAWNADGGQLAYFMYKGEPPPFGKDEDEARLGTLVTRDVVYEDRGGLAAEQAGVRERAGVLFQSFAGLQYAPDGSLLFAAVEATLPGTEADMPQGWRLFRWAPTYPKVVTHVLPAAAVRAFDAPSSVAWFFAVSPDGKRVLLAGDEDETHKQYLYDLHTGECTVLEGIASNFRGIAPTWRSAGEITAVVVPGDERGSANRNELVLIKLGADGKPTSSRCLSRDWPDEWVKDWFEVKKPASQPTE